MKILVAYTSTHTSKSASILITCCGGGGGGQKKLDNKFCDKGFLLESTLLLIRSVTWGVFVSLFGPKNLAINEIVLKTYFGAFQHPPPCHLLPDY
jgi:hypothetical protein